MHSGRRLRRLDRSCGLGAGALDGRDRPGDASRDQEHDAVDGDAYPDGPREANSRQQQEARRDGAANGADGIHRIEKTDTRPDLSLGSYDVSGQHRQGCAHARGGNGEDHERDQQIEDRLAGAARIGWRRLIPEDTDIENIRQRQEQRYGKCRQGDAGLEQAVHEYRPSNAIDNARGDRRAEGQPGHIGGQNRGDG